MNFIFRVRYGVAVDKCIANKKDGKTYFHFFDGLVTDSVIMKNDKGLPKRATLLNTGCELECRTERLMSSIGKYTDSLSTEYLVIGKIPTDELESEAIVIEVEW